MGIHSSFKRTDALAAHRSVMKRPERIKWLMEKGLWDDQRKVKGLPKIKVMRLKAAKKEKTKAAETPEAGAAAVTAAPGAPAAPKAAAPKAAGEKTGDKK